MLDERVWAEIDLGALAHNAAKIKENLGGVKLMAVIKADAYGHGAIQSARALSRRGADYLAVACLSEAMELRNSGITLPILILGYTPPERAGTLAQNNLTITVFDLEYAKQLSANAVSLGVTLTAHIKTDTGMSRLGLQSSAEVLEVLKLPNLRAEGLFSHLANADHPDDPFVAEQLRAFNKITDELSDIKFDITHCANTGGVLYYKESWLNMVRAGLILFGAAGGCKPVMRLVARIAQVKNIKAGDTVSYGRTYTAARDVKAAVVCAGYADGYMRALSNKGFADCNGVLVPVIGNVCMDMLMLDVTGLDVKMNDTVTLFGSKKLSAATLAAQAGTIPYELLCAVSRRVPRIYREEDGDGVKLYNPKMSRFM